MSLYNQKLQPDWWTKTITGLILGLTFAIAIATIIFLLALPYIERNTLSQVAMWSIPWIWLSVFFAAYYIPKGWQSLVIFSIANVLAYALIFWLRG